MAQQAWAQGGGAPATLQELNRYAYAQNAPPRCTDPTGHWIERAVDSACIAYDSWDIARNGLTWDTGLALAADVGGLLLPGLTGVGMAVCGGRAAKAAVEAASHGDEVVDAGQAVAKAAGHADDAADAARAAAQGGEAAADAARTAAQGGEAAVHGAGQPHKNANHAVSHFGIYEIKVNGETYKFGKADLDRVTQSSGLPTRVHQQVRRLSKTYDDVRPEIVDLGYITAQQAKQAERAALQRYYETTRRIPPGNQKSFRRD